MDEELVSKSNLCFQIQPFNLLLCRSYVTAGNKAAAAAQDFSRAGAGAGGAGGGLGGIGYNAMLSVLRAAGLGREVGLALFATLFCSQITIPFN